MSEVPCSTKGVVTDGDVSRLSDQTAAESRFQTTSQRPRATQAHDCLCALLDQEDYLSKVLGCLIDDGLHECRRVCRKWRNVCSALPVHLIRVPWEHLPDTHLTFPKAASLSVATKTMCRGLPEFLPSLTNIRRLTLTGMSLWHCTCLRQIFPRQLCDHLPSLPQLESLTLEGVLEHTSAFLSLTADHLTRLTQLKIDLKLGSGWDMEPLFQVRKLRSLSLDLNHLFTTNGSLTFPSLTRLTRLEVTYAMTFDTDILMALKPYAATLKSLVISCLYPFVFGPDPRWNWTPLSAVFQLESLSVPPTSTVDTNLLREFGRMRDLTELDIGKVDLAIPNIAELVFSLTNLKSLRFVHDDVQQTICSATSGIQSLTRLTRLDTNCLFHVSSLRCLVQLATVRAGIADGGSYGPECPSIGLELLEDLDLSAYGRVPSGLLSNLWRLKRLRLLVAHDDLDEDFFLTLASLTQLTHLDFIENSEEAPPLEFHTQFNRLTSLRTLTIHAHEKWSRRVPSPCAFLLEGGFPLLRSLRFKGYVLSANEQCELMRRFHCLNTVEEL